MPKYYPVSKEEEWYINDLTHRLVAKTGIPSDRYHLGKIILQCLRDSPEFVLQIDGATGERETCGSVWERTIKCAITMKKLGLKRNDVIVLMASNCLDLCIPMYASFCIGVAVAGVDRTLKTTELQETFSYMKPKIIFCQSKRSSDVNAAVANIGLDAKVVTIDKSEDAENFTDLLNKHGNGQSVEGYRPDDFDPTDTNALLMSTSGTSGKPKSTESTHYQTILGFGTVWGKASSCLIMSPIQWLSAIIYYLLAPVLKMTRIQSSLDMTKEHVYYLINTYKPEVTICSPTFMVELTKPPDCEKCDFTCFTHFFIGGSAVSQKVIDNLEAVAPDAYILVGYGMSEANGMVLLNNTGEAEICGKENPFFKYRLVDPYTGEDIHVPNKSGELWVKGPSVCKGYYNNPEMTSEMLSEDGWLKTGDMFYRDEHRNYYFADRLKLLLKYRNHQVSPAEIEEVIQKHPSVLHVAVTSIPDLECGDLPVAIVVRHEGKLVTAQEIKDLVKDNLADTKQLRGGVIFLESMPLTPTTKINRPLLKKMASELKRE